MRVVERGLLCSMCVAAITLCLILSGCGVSSVTQAQRPLANTPTPLLATATPYPTTASYPILESPGCPPVAQVQAQPQYVKVGALKVSAPQRMMDYPSTMLPTNAPSAPFKIAANAVNNYAPNPVVNPQLANGYIFQVCNETGAAHTLTSIHVNIASFQASSGPVAVWHLCQDGPYNAATKTTTGGCGGGFGGVDWLQATFSNDSTGASAPATANSQIGVNLPMSIGPNMSAQVLIAVSGLTSQGAYALAFGVSVDDAAPATVTPSDGPFIMAPSATVWTGTACQAAAMQAHIPAASQDTYYVCPPGA